MSRLMHLTDERGQDQTWPKLWCIDYANMHPMTSVSVVVLSCCMATEHQPWESWWVLLWSCSWVMHYRETIHCGPQGSIACKPLYGYAGFISLQRASRTFIILPRWILPTFRVNDAEEKSRTMCTIYPCPNNTPIHIKTKSMTRNLPFSISV